MWLLQHKFPFFWLIIIYPETMNFNIPITFEIATVQGGYSRYFFRILATTIFIRKNFIILAIKNSVTFCIKYRSIKFKKLRPSNCGKKMLNFKVQLSVLSFFFSMSSNSIWISFEISFLSISSKSISQYLKNILARILCVHSLLHYSLIHPVCDR